MNITKYGNKMQYPAKPKKPYLNHIHTSEEITQYAEDFKKYENSLSKCMEEQKKYRIEQNRLDNLFKQDIFKELGIEKHPKKDILWSIAWVRAHSDGLQCVWFEMEELSELLT